MSGSATRIELCGRLLVELEGRRIEDALPGRQGRLLFAFMALNRTRPVRRDELIDAVWPDHNGGPSGDALLRPPLSRLRKALGEGWLEGRSELMLRLPSDAWIDWEAAGAALGRAREATAARDWRSALDAAQEAVVIADKGLLPGLEADWIDERRRELADLRVEALETVANAAAALGGADLPAAERAARAAVEAAPFRESARLALMESLRAAGNIAEALRAYDELRTMLREELGATPSPRVVALHERLLRADEEEPPVAEPAPRAAPAPRPRTAAPIVERDAELTLIDQLIADAAGGAGRVAALEGAPGVGKSVLLAEGRRRAGDAGMTALSARGSELEREFAFGVVRQLLEGAVADPERHEQLLSGGAAPAAAVFDAPGAGGEALDASFAALNGLFALTQSLALERPLALSIDDIQWCDRPSLRFLAYLTRRIEDLPVLVITTLRSGETAVDAGLLGEILQDPVTSSIRPRPLSEDAVRELLLDRLGEPADDAFTAACHRATVGNPLLLRQLLTALAGDGVRPVAENLEMVPALGTGAVSRTILLRLARLGDEATAAARAVAVLGETAPPQAVAALAGLDDASLERALHALGRAEILRAEPPPAFEHPLVRDAVYHELSLGMRELQHSRAARVLADVGATREHVAAHLLAVPPRGDAWVSDALQEAGRSAMRKAAADSAATYLRRALEEPPPEAERVGILFELGVAESLTSGPTAAEHLRAAYDAVSEPVQRGLIANALARTLIFTGHEPEGAELARRAAAEMPEELADLRQALEAIDFCSVYFGAGDWSRLDRLEPYRSPPGDGVGAKMIAAIASLDWAWSAGPADECAELALAALDGGAIIAADNGVTPTTAITTLAVAERPEALDWWKASVDDAFRRGSLFSITAIHLWHALTLYFNGELREAEALLRSAFDQFELWGYGPKAPLYGAAFLSATLKERGKLDEARRVVSSVLDPEDGTDGARFLLDSRLDLLLAAGRYDEAIEVADECARRYPRVVNPAVERRRSLKAEALAALGRGDEAVALVTEELEFARRFGAPGTIGRVLRSLAAVEPDSAAALEHLRESVELLGSSPRRLEYAKSLAALGAKLEGAEAEAMLTQAAQLAEACGADDPCTPARQRSR